MLKLLLILISLLSVALASRENPFATENSLPPAGRGFLSDVALSYDEIVSCLFESMDTKQDNRLTRSELQRGPEKYMTWVELFHSGLTPETLIAKCDHNSDGVIEMGEMELHNGEECLSAVQQESISRYICSRKKHKSIVSAEYKSTYDMWRQAFSKGTLYATYQAQMAHLDRVVNPHHSRLVGSRVVLPSQDKFDQVGRGIPPQLILFLAAAYLIILVIVLFVIYVLPNLVEVVGTVVGIAAA